MQDGFKVVKNRRKKYGTKRSPFKEDLFTSPESYIHVKVKKTLEEFKESHFYFQLLSVLEECCQLIGSSLDVELICYGLGNFTENKSSLHQLAALLAISGNYKASTYVFDPTFQAFEIDILKRLNLNVLTENEEGKRHLKSGRVTLLFLPHCPKQLTNNFLWANWNSSLKNSILITNSFSKIITNNSERTIQDSAKYIFEIFPQTREIELVHDYFLDNTFNDLSVHYFPELTAAFFLDKSNEEPVYSDDIEFITKQTDRINF